MPVIIILALIVVVAVVIVKSRSKPTVPPAPVMPPENPRLQSFLSKVL